MISTTTYPKTIQQQLHPSSLGYQRAQLLASHPEIGYRYERAVNRDIRVLLYGHYRIAYLIKHGGDIDILGVFHGAMQISRYLFDGNRT